MAATCSSIGDAPSLPQRRALHHLRHALQSDLETALPADTWPTSEAALGELLKEKAHGYSCFNRGSLAEYCRGAVSLRKGSTSVPLESLLPESWRSRLCPETLLCSGEERGEKMREEGEPYFDKALQADPWLYADYLADLHEAG